MIVQLAATVSASSSRVYGRIEVQLQAEDTSTVQYVVRNVHDSLYNHDYNKEPSASKALKTSNSEKWSNEMVYNPGCVTLILPPK